MIPQILQVFETDPEIQEKIIFSDEVNSQLDDFVKKQNFIWLGNNPQVIQIVKKDHNFVNLSYGLNLLLEVSLDFGFLNTMETHLQ